MREVRWEGVPAVTPSDSAVIYDPTSDSVVAITSMVTARQNATATLLQTGEVLVTGGQVRGEDNVTRTLRSAELFIP